MSKKISKIGVVLKPSDFDDLENLISNLVRWLVRRKKDVIFLESEFERFNSILPTKIVKLMTFKDANYVFNESDLLISLGGDGTLIGACREVKSSIPIFGVNLGRLGFITEFSKKEFFEKLAEILAGKFNTHKKQLFSIIIEKHSNLQIKEYFFNDVVFNKHDIARMFTLSVEANGDHIYNLSGDGLIISSTMGSTAYSLAAGGPIVHPEVKALLLTPICPHSLTQRPLVIPDNFEISIQLVDNIESACVTVDGQLVFDIGSKDKIIVKKESRRSVSLVENSERSYFHTLKEKFVHGRRDA